ncbi:MAG: hemolysin III family protein [Clostridia bacterium]|nr:hemolysin III family protein [Clostridia bacterium]
MTRTKLKDRILPAYTTGEEIFNMVTHIVGTVFGAAALVLCVLLSARKGDVWGVVGSAVYGASLILLYTMSSVYHGLRPGMGKRVLQVLDHCTIYFLIGGTYTPILLTKIRQTSAAWAWVIFGLVWGFAILATVLTAIDIKKYAKFSMACYIGMGWCIVLAAKTAVEAIPIPGLLWLLGGGVAYTVGAVLYGVGKKKRYVHSIFHLFVLAGSALQFICLYFFVL